jgi:hypothetical protein
MASGDNFRGCRTCTKAMEQDDHLGYIAHWMACDECRNSGEDPFITVMSYFREPDEYVFVSYTSDVKFINFNFF